MIGHTFIPLISYVHYLKLVCGLIGGGCLGRMIVGKLSASKLHLKYGLLNDSPQCLHVAYLQCITMLP